MVACSVEFERTPLQIALVRRSLNYFVGEQHASEEWNRICVVFDTSLTLFLIFGPEKRWACAQIASFVTPCQVGSISAIRKVRVIFLRHKLLCTFEFSSLGLGPTGPGPTRPRPTAHHLTDPWALGPGPQAPGYKARGPWAHGPRAFMGQFLKAPHPLSQPVPWAKIICGKPHLDHDCS